MADDIEATARAMWENDVGRNGIDPTGRKTRPTWDELPRYGGPVAYWRNKARIAKATLALDKAKVDTDA